MSIFAGLIMLAIAGASLVWQGLTGGGLRTPMGSPIIPGWMYVIAGLFLVAVSVGVGLVWLDLVSL